MDIETLSKLDDAELSKKLGIDKRLDEAKEAIAEMVKLEGKPREYAEERIKKMFEPHIYPDDFKYIVEDAKCKSDDAKEQKDNCCCGSVL